jgi:hypothetical protein
MISDKSHQHTCEQKLQRNQSIQRKEIISPKTRSFTDLLKRFQNWNGLVRNQKRTHMAAIQLRPPRTLENVHVR